MSNFENMQRVEVDMTSEPIIKIEHVSKAYTLYKSDQERFRALFKKPKNPIIHNRTLIVKDNFRVNSLVTSTCTTHT